MKFFLEIKHRLILVATTYVSMWVTCYFYKETLLFLTTQSFSMSHFTYFIFTDVTEVFSVYLQLTQFLTMQVTLAYMVYHSFTFFSPAFFDLEHYYLKLFLKTILIVWVLSGWISIYLLVPLSWQFFLSFQELALVSLHFEAKLNEYVSFCILMYHLCVLYCQILVILFFFMGYINANVVYIKKFRKLYYFFFIFFSTLISPPEVMSQIVLSSIVICTYEFLLFLFVLKISSSRLLIR